MLDANKKPIELFKGKIKAKIAGVGIIASSEFHLLTPAHTNRHSPSKYHRRACIRLSGQTAAHARRRRF